MCVPRNIGLYLHWLANKPLVYLSGRRTKAIDSVLHEMLNNNKDKVLHKIKIYRQKRRKQDNFVHMNRR